ncbi:Ger(x)C family spore germination protein [Paenibacillus cremeus]|nr:Ger(x)C family spore germination protein [Paenibacillus cremeus]
MNSRAHRVCIFRLGLSMAIACLLLTGCWDRHELNQLGFTAATGIDYKDGQWMMSYQVVIPSALSSSVAAGTRGAAKLPIVVYSTQGKTIREATWKNELESPRHLYFTHNRVIIVSTTAVEQGLSLLLDVYLRNLESRETVSVLICEGEAREILKQLMQIQVIPADGIEEMIKDESQHISALPNVQMYRLAKELLGTSKSAVLPEVFISGSPEVTNPDKLGQTALSSLLKLGRLAVLNQDKLVGWLSLQEALGVNFIRNMVKNSTFSFPCEESSSVENSTFQLLSTKTRLTPHKIGDHFVIDIEVKGKGVLLETDCPVDLTKPNTEQDMEAQLNKKITETIEKSWSAVKKLKTDVVGFGDLIHRKYPNDWKRVGPNWQTEFVKIEIRPKADITIKRTGLTTKSFKLQRQQK